MSAVNISSNRNQNTQLPAAATTDMAPAQVPALPDANNNAAQNTQLPQAAALHQDPTTIRSAMPEENRAIETQAQQEQTEGKGQKFNNKTLKTIARTLSWGGILLAIPDYMKGKLLLGKWNLASYLTMGIGIVMEIALKVKEKAK